MIVEFGKHGSIKDLFLSIDPNHSQVLTLISGDPGHGKTSFACACALENMSHKQLKNVKHACEKIDYLNTFKRANFRYPSERHLVYVTGFKVEKFSPKMKSYDFDPWRVGMGDPTYQTIYFPMHSLRIWDEMQTYYPSQQDQPNSKLPLRVSTEFQKCRHYDIYNIGTSQVSTDIHYKLRRIASFIVTKKTIRHKNKFNVVTQTSWQTLYFVNRFAYDAYISSNGDESYATKKITFIFKGNIGRHYNHTSCETEFDEVDNKYCEYDQLYEEPNCLVPPPGYSTKESKGGNKKE